MFRVSREGACNSAGPPTKACADAAPPHEGSVQLRRSAHQSVCRRCASPQGERATPPVRLSKVYRRRASPRGERATPPVRLSKVYRRRASPRGERATPPVRLPRCIGAAPPREGSVQLRRFAHHSVCRRRASPRGERATPPVRLSKVYRRRASPRGERAPAPVRPPRRVPTPRLPARGVCTCAGPPD